MSGLPTVNVVDDEQMSSEGSVNAPVAPPRSPSVHSARAQSPVAHLDLSAGRVSPVAKILQSDIAGQRGSASVFGTVQSTEVVGAPTVPVDVPTREETKQAFAEVSSALRDVSTQHDEVQAGMQSLASGVETLRRARAADLETSAQVQATLQRTLSTSSSLEARMEQAELSQAQAKSAAAEAHLASQRALQQAARLEEEQAKTASQLQHSLSAQAQQAQSSIADATQIAYKTAKDVKTLSETASKAEYLAQITAAKMEEQIAQLNLKMQEQQSLAVQEAKSAQEAQTKLTQQLEEARQLAQSTRGRTTTYEVQLAEVTKQMKVLEQLLVDQRMKGNSLENQLSAAQDRIGGAERRAQQLAEENVQIKSELQYWNELYAQDTAGENVDQINAEVDSNPLLSVPVAPETSKLPSPRGIFNAANTLGSATVPDLPPWSILAESSTAMGATSMAPPLRNFDIPSSNVGPEISPFLPTQQRDRRVSFGSTFAGSSGTGGNGGGGNGTAGVGGAIPPTLPTTAAMFRMDIKPKEPPIFRGTAQEDVDSWLAKVEDFIYLTEANMRQQVAYMATLLQDAAGDWWAALLKERHGSRPADFAEMSALLRKRFGSSTRVDRARAALRNVKQLQNENVRAYSSRFESLLAKLPSYDVEWAKSQYIWGLNQKVAELVVIAEPVDLQAAILKAEKIEMARSTVSGHTGQSSSGWFRGNRGRFTRGRGRFAAAVQTTPGPSNYQSGQGQHQNAGVQPQSGQQGPRPNLMNVQCYRCQGWGHTSFYCPSSKAVQYRGGRGGGRARGRMQRGRGRGGRARGRGQSVNASLIASGSGAPAPPPQVQEAAPVPAPPGPGN